MLRCIVRLLSTLALGTLCACSSESDFQRDGATWRYRGLAIAGADAASFRVLDAHHAKDRRQVWYADTERKGQEYYLIAHPVVRVIDGADAASFALLRSGYARDHAAVFHEGRRLAVADVAGFEPLDHGFARDRLRAYYQTEPIAGSTGAAFRVLDAHHAEDGRRILHAAMDYGSGRPRVSVLQGAEPASFVLLEGGYATSAQRVYFEGRVLAGADAASFRTQTPATAEDADASDARRRYRRGQVLVPGAAPEAASAAASGAGSAPQRRASRG